MKPGYARRGHEVKLVLLAGKQAPADALQLQYGSCADTHCLQSTTIVRQWSTA